MKRYHAWFTSHAWRLSIWLQKLTGLSRYTLALAIDLTGLFWVFMLPGLTHTDCWAGPMGHLLMTSVVGLAHLGWYYDLFQASLRKDNGESILISPVSFRLAMNTRGYWLLFSLIRPAWVTWWLSRTISIGPGVPPGERFLFESPDAARASS